MNKLKIFFNTNISFLLLLIIIVFLLYGKSINYNLLYFDDDTSLKINSEFMTDIKNLPKIFVRDVYLSEQLNQSYYRPILALSFTLETLVFGQNSKVNHITNLILFVLSIYLMYAFLIKLKFNKNITEFVLLLFTVSPLLTSNAVYVSPRAESFFAIFSILTFLYTDKYFYDNKVKNLFFSALFFLLALWSKESAIVLIAVIPIFLYSIDKFSIKKILKLYVWLIFPVTVYFVFRKIAGSNISFDEYWQYFIDILKNILNGYIIYINKILIPENIPVCLYNYSADLKSILKVLIFILCLIIIYCRNFINRKFILFAASIFVLFLLPSFFILQNQIFFHRLLLPVLGFIIIFVLLVQKIIELFPVSKKYLLFLWLILFAIFSYGAFLQADKYKTNISFSLNGYKDAPEYNAFVVGMTGTYLFALDYNENALNSIHEQDYRKLNEWAIILCKCKKFEQAEKILKRLISLNINTPFCYANLGLLYEDKQDYLKALEYAQKAALVSPTNINFKENLARMYYLNGKYQQALDIYEQLLKNAPHNAQYYYGIGSLYYKLGDKQKAAEYINKAVDIDFENSK
ncbi:tetratricopeptide repeat protein [Candidatus Ruminimicrobium bovinum]|uniref:tetratricopeptide repeat protein n=1 Tax=Candidatus Ruminimicrobium bovinum TaxID=3242779 RepID=UPI0039B921CD